MGVDNVASSLITVGNEWKASDKCNKNQKFGVDMSCLIHRHLSIASNSEFFLASESIKLYDALKSITQFIKNLADKCRIVYCVFDGLPYPLKNETANSRVAHRNEMKSKLTALLDEAWCKYEADTDNCKDAFILRQSAFKQTPFLVYRRSNFVADLITTLKDMKNVEICYSPYEADHQLAYMYQQSIIHVVVTVDSDLYVCGCKKIVLLRSGGKAPIFVNLEGEAGLRREKKFINHLFANQSKKWSNEGFEDQDNLLNDAMVDHLRMWAVLKGCDYVKLKWVQGTNKPQNILECYVQYLQWMKQITCNNVNITEIECRRQFLEEFLRKFGGNCLQNALNGDILTVNHLYNAWNTFKYGPALSINNTLHPIYNLQDGSVWSSCLGFQPSAAIGRDSLKYDGSKIVHELPNGDIVIRSTDTLVTPTHTATDSIGEFNIHGAATIKFNEIRQVFNTPDRVLVLWLEARGVLNNNNKVNNRIIFDLVASSIGNDDLQIVRPCATRVGTWRSFDNLMTTEEQPELNWITPSTQGTSKIQDFLCSKTKKINLDDSCLNINRKRQSIIRSSSLFVSGHIELDSLRIAECNLCTTNAPVTAVQCNVMASFKIGVSYNIVVIYTNNKETNDTGDVIKGDLYKTLISYCTCPVGRSGCSHLFAILMMIGAMQTEVADSSGNVTYPITLQRLQQLMPTPIRLYMSIPFPWRTALRILYEERNNRRSATIEANNKRKFNQITSDENEDHGDDL